MPKCPQLQLANMKHGTKTCIADAVRVVLKSGVSLRLGEA
jgi:hypothetical protein